MAKTKSKPTLEDIAGHSGVSIATVSRVLNASGPVSKELETRVKKAMQDLGMAKSRPDFVAFIIPEVLNPANTQIMAGVYEEAEKLGVCLVTLSISETPHNQRHNLKMFKHFSFDGLIVLHEQVACTALVNEYDLAELPIVIIGRTTDLARVHCIDTDRETGIYQAAKYLLSLNHTNIAYLSGPPDWRLSKVRLQGIQRALVEAGLELSPQLHWWGIPSIESGFQMAGSVLQLPEKDRPTAILAFNDLMAIGALHAVRSAGLQIPEDVSVVGFDNIYITPHTNPPLTTIAQPKFQIGQLAVQKIYNILNGHDLELGGLTLLECPLIVRESTAPRKL